MKQLLLMVLLLLVLAGFSFSQTLPAALDEPVPMFGLFEVSLVSSETLANPFWDVAASAIFTSPSGKGIHVDGFYYAGDQWRVRFPSNVRGTGNSPSCLTAPSR